MYLLWYHDQMFYIIYIKVEFLSIFRVSMAFL